MQIYKIINNSREFFEFAAADLTSPLGVMFYAGRFLFRIMIFFRT